MNWRGHLGFNMFITSSIAYFLGFTGSLVNQVIIISSVLSSIPDIDLRIELSHRGLTHNVFFSFFASLLGGYVTNVLGLGYTLGFASVLTAFLTHLVADLLTYMPFNPLYPLVEGKYSLKLFKSDNALVNNLMLVLGVFTYYVYIRSYGFSI
ncbi:MAG: hypothetical protein B7O98_06830 [Zestosphaera tikiterensis]|uniref:Metal-dependent hydrolase n=1 Tax=Zestosphaera tikiterensis TaxID=1973259 RepID=A0A2R7Y484_9CREN|nr:MAG: hypothetical protein B7O98_06830 [Zestosphaera tikiterensis]